VHSVFPVNHIGKILWIWIIFDTLNQIFWFFQEEASLTCKKWSKLSEMEIFFSISSSLISQGIKPDLKFTLKQDYLNSKSLKCVFIIKKVHVTICRTLSWMPRIMVLCKWPLIETSPISESGDTRLSLFAFRLT